MNLDHVQLLLRAVAPNGCWSDLYLDLTENKEFEFSLKAHGT